MSRRRGWLLAAAALSPLLALLLFSPRAPMPEMRLNGYGCGSDRDTFEAMPQLGGYGVLHDGEVFVVPTRERLYARVTYRVRDGRVQAEADFDGEASRVPAPETPRLKPFVCNGVGSAFPLPGFQGSLLEAGGDMVLLEPGSAYTVEVSQVMDPDEDFVTAYAPVSELPRAPFPQDHGDVYSVHATLSGLTYVNGATADSLAWVSGPPGSRRLQRLPLRPFGIDRGG